MKLRTTVKCLIQLMPPLGQKPIRILCPVGPICVQQPANFGTLDPDSGMTPIVPPPSSGVTLTSTRLRVDPLFLTMGTAISTLGSIGLRALGVTIKAPLTRITL